MTFQILRAIVANALVISSVLLLHHGLAYGAPHVLWQVRVINSSKFTFVSQVACDKEGNNYLYGPIRGAALINGVSVAEVTNGMPNVLAKFTPSGELDWAIRMGVGMVKGLAATTVSGEVMLFGDYWESTTIGTNVISEQPFGTTVIAKFGSEGRVVGLHKLEKKGGNFSIEQVVVDANGFLHACFAANGKISIGTNILSGFGPDESYVVAALIDPDGQTRWALPLQGVQARNIGGISSDAQGNTYIAGSFASQALIGKTQLTSMGKSDAFIAKLDLAGRVQWARSFGNTGADQIQAIAVDGSLNCYISGAFSHVVDFDHLRISAEAEQDIFLSRLNEAGEVSWTRAYGGKSFEGATGLAVDNFGACWMSGYYSESFSSLGLTDGTVFIAKFDLDGTPTWSRSLGREGEDRRRRLAMDGFGNIFIIGEPSGFAKDQTNSIILATKLGRE